MIDPKTLTREQAQNIKDHLEAAKKLLEMEGGWIKGAYAKNSEGVRVLTDSANACSFCSLGALYRICEDRDMGKAYEHVGLASGVLELILHRKGHRGWDSGFAGDEPHLAGFNDHYRTTHAMVLKLFQDGIDELGTILSQPPSAGGG